MEFILIIVGTIISASVIGVFISILFEKGSKSIKSILNHKESSNVDQDLTRKIIDNQQSIEEKSKFRMNRLFYHYCFSIETAKMFLEENTLRPTIARALYLSILDKENFLELTFKLYLKKVHALELETIGYKFYKYNGYKFYLDVDRVNIEGEVTFFEILRNGFEDVRDHDGNNCAIANEFMVYVKDTLPVAIFVIVIDPILDKLAIREVYKDGTSAILTFLDTNDDNEAIDFLQEFVDKK